MQKHEECEEKGAAKTTGKVAEDANIGGAKEDSSATITMQECATSTSPRSQQSARVQVCSAQSRAVYKHVCGRVSENMQKVGLNSHPIGYRVLAFAFETFVFFLASAQNLRNQNEANFIH